MRFEERTIAIVVDEAACTECTTHACIAACAVYGRSVIGLADGHPEPAVASDELKRLGTECLACEEACRLHGRGALRIEAPIPGLDRLRASFAAAGEVG